MQTTIWTPASLLVGLLLAAPGSAQLGTPYCTAAANSTGVAAELGATGSADVVDNDVTLQCRRLPVGSFGYVLVAREPGAVSLPGGNPSTLCLAGPIGRYSGTPLVANAAGEAVTSVDLTQVPHPQQAFAVLDGDTLRFQYWYRDTTPAGPTSRFSRALEVQFCPSPPYPGERFAMGQNPMDPELVDLDRDGALDVVTSDLLDAAVLVRLGRGDGTFGAAVRTVVLQDPLDIVARDFGGDGVLDLAVLSRFGAVSVLTGLGDGSFGARVDHPVGATPTSLAAGDLEGDGDVDLVAANRDDRTISVLRNVAGAFVPQVAHRTGLTPRHLALGDVDGDGDSDLVVMDLDRFEVLLASSNGSYVVGQVVQLPDRAQSSSLGDLDGDGDLDLVVPIGSLRALALFENQLGVFSGRGRVTCEAVDFEVTLGDLDADGRQDLVFAASTAEPALWSAKNRGGFVFDAPARFGPCQHGTLWVALGDLDGDGAADAVGCSPSGDVSVQLARTAGPAAFGARSTLDSGFYELLAGDLDLDGDEDVVAMPVSFGGFHTLENAGGALGAAVGVALPGNLDVVAGRLGDLDGDGDLDVVAGATDWTNNGVLFVPNVGPLAFGPPTLTALTDMVERVALGDVDRDGDLDVVAVTTSQALNSPPSLVVLRNSGAGALAVASQVTLANRVHDLALADLDGDDDLDVLLAGALQAPSTLEVLTNDGNGQFTGAASIGAPPMPVALQVADCDRDGDEDIVALSHVTAELAVLRNQGGGVFTSSLVTPDAGDALALEAGDVDGDGDLDLVVGAADALTFHLNAGDGTFRAPRRFTASADGVDIALVDLDGDGDLDSMSLFRDASVVGAGPVSVIVTRLSACR